MDKSFVLFFIIGLTTVTAQRFGPHSTRFPFRADKACRADFDCRAPEECIKGQCFFIPAKCNSLPDIEHGSIHPHATQYDVDTEIRFVCNTGYKMDGFPRSKCKANGLWTQGIPKCEKRGCASPVRPFRGSIKSTKTIFTVGEEVLYECHGFYRLVGARSTRCKEDGTWTNPRPDCLKPNEK